LNALELDGRAIRNQGLFATERTSFKRSHPVARQIKADILPLGSLL
jgi:hypothetical protein